MNGYTSVKIPKQLANTLRDSVKQAGFTGLSDYVTHLLRVAELRGVEFYKELSEKSTQPQPSDSEVITGRFELPVKDAIAILNRIQETIENTIKEKKALGEDVSNLVELSNKIRAILEDIASSSLHSSVKEVREERGETQ